MYAITSKATTNNKVIVDKPTEKMKWNQKIPQWIQGKEQKEEIWWTYKSNIKIVYLHPTTSLTTLDEIGLYTPVKRLSDCIKKREDFQHHCHYKNVNWNHNKFCMPIGMAKIKKPDLTKYFWGCGVIRTLRYCWHKYKMVYTLQKKLVVS